MRILTTIFLTLLFGTISGCKSSSDEQVYIAKYAECKFKIDGKLDEKAWEKAQKLSFQALDGSSCTENGTVRIAWDKNYIYVGAKLYDSDIVQESDENWIRHYQTGDVIEVFLKPQSKHYYWEIYSTPNSKRTAFFYLAKGRLGIPSGFACKMPELIVASSCEGSFNNAGDCDRYWTTEIAIPKKQLEKQGEQIAPGRKWSFLVARYNYSVHFNTLPELSLTGTPAGGGGFHNFKSWKEIKFSISPQ